MHHVTTTPGQLVSCWLLRDGNGLDRLSGESGIPAGEIRDLAYGNTLPLVGDRARLDSLARSMGMAPSSMGYRGVMRAGELSTTGQSMRFRMSTSGSDRYSDIVIQDFDLAGFRANPVAPWAHNYAIPPIGKWENVGLAGPPHQLALEGLLVFDDNQDNPLGQQIARQYREGYLNTCSVGFLPTAAERRAELDQDDPLYARSGFVFRGNILLECSAVSVPGNAAAVALRSAAVASGAPTPRGVSSDPSWLDWLIPARASRETIGDWLGG